LREPLSHEELSDEDTSLPDWHNKVSSLVSIRVEEEKKRTASTQVQESPEAIIERETDALIRRKLEEVNPDTWPCYRCDKVFMKLITKYFRGAEFVVNHIRVKHQNRVSECKKKALISIMMDSYTNDKDKIMFLPQQIDKYFIYKSKNSSRQGEKKK